MERRAEEDEESFPLGRSGGAARRGVSSAFLQVWPTVDGPLGAETEAKALGIARKLFLCGFFCLPWLWAVNCFYFWPVLFSKKTHPSSPAYLFPRLRGYVVRSAIGFLVVTLLLASWAFTFSIGGERLFGPIWSNLVMYNVADRLGLTAWN